MTPSSSSADAASKPLPMPLEVVLYPFHFIPRVLAKTLVFLAAVVGIIAAPIVLLLLLLFVLLPILPCDALLWEDLLDHLTKLARHPWFGLVAHLGVATALLGFVSKSMQDSLRRIGKKFQNMKPGWRPRLDLRRSLAQTRRYYLRKVMRTGGKLLSLSLKFIFGLVLLLLLAAYHYARAVAQDNVLESVKELQARPDVVVVAGGGGAGDGLPAFATPFYSGGVYSIAHVKQGSLENGNGICLDDHVSLPWLKTFKTALEECAAKMPGCRPGVNVRGFASNAPVSLPDALSSAGLSQAVLNCEIANRRAEEVVNFLVSKGDYKCQASAHDLPPYGKRDPCKRSKELFKFGETDGLAFDVRYEPWRPPEAMVREKPADDGDLQGERRHKVEFFNRAVQLTLSNYGCDREQCEAPSQEEGAGEQGATSRDDDAEDKADDSSNGTPDARVETE